jgi:hypothetical protein
VGRPRRLPVPTDDKPLGFVEVLGQFLGPGFVVDDDIAVLGRVEKESIISPTETRVVAVGRPAMDERGEA